MSKAKMHTDLQQLKDWNQFDKAKLQDKVKAMREAVKQGTVIIIENQFNNKPADKRQEFNTLKALNQWLETDFPKLEEEE